MQKRISALLLAMVIVIGSVLVGNTLKVKAASVAVSEDFAVELTMMIYNLLETVAISSGIKDGLDDYESGSSLYDAFIASMESMAEPPFYDTIITMEDGSKMTVKEALDAAESTLGSNALKLPTSETFAKYRVISGTGGNEQILLLLRPLIRIVHRCRILGIRILFHIFRMCWLLVRLSQLWLGSLLI